MMRRRFHISFCEWRPGEVARQVDIRLGALSFQFLSLATDEDWRSVWFGLDWPPPVRSTRPHRFVRLLPVFQ